MVRYPPWACHSRLKNQGGFSIALSKSVCILEKWQNKLKWLKWCYKREQDIKNRSRNSHILNLCFSTQFWFALSKSLTNCMSRHFYNDLENKYYLWQDLYNYLHMGSSASCIFSIRSCSLQNNDETSMFKETRPELRFQFSLGALSRCFLCIQV